jgi:hypothetical protein
MSSRLIYRYIIEKLRDRSTYILALIVGSIINLYGQFLLPWFRGSFDPPVDFLIEFEIRPEVTIFSVFLGFAFPFCVGLYSAVATRYKKRRIEAIATLPDLCPDPMFLADKSGRIVAAGAGTEAFLAGRGIDDARAILGEDLWLHIIGGEPMSDRPMVQLESEGATYVVAYTPGENGNINIYLARLPRDL